MDTKKYTESQFLAVQEVKDSQSKTLVVLSAGTEQPDDKGKVRYQCLIEIDGRQRLFRPNRPTLQNMQKSWGFESNLWIGKRLSLGYTILQGKEAILGTPIA